MGSHLVVSCPQTVTAGHAFEVTIKAEDSHGHIFAGYNGLVELESLEGDHEVWGEVRMHHGIAQVRLTEDIAGHIKFFATTAGLEASCSALIAAATATHFTVDIPVETLHSPISVTVTAEDQFGNTVTGYNGPVTLSVSPGANVTLPAGPVNLANGTVTFDIVVNAAIEFQLTASDGTIQGTSDLIMF
jgi:adhesin/invasin